MDAANTQARIAWQQAAAAFNAATSEAPSIRQAGVATRAAAAAKAQTSDNNDILDRLGNIANQIKRAVIDIVAVPPYLAYDLSHYSLKAVNSFGDQFGPAGTVVSRVVGAPLLIPKTLGLGTDIGIDSIKGEDWADESRNQCDTRPINPLHSQGFVPSFLRGGPKWYLPGAYRDGQGDPHVKWEW